MGEILASSRYDLDPIPRGLKPPPSHLIGGTAEAVPFPQSDSAMSRAILQNDEKTQVSFANLHPCKQACWGPRPPAPNDSLSTA
jgi:hypothetical protein